MPQLVARGLTIDIDRPMIMAVINATPDSFSDAGKYATVEARMERTREVLAQGADILDIGGQSAITGVPEISEDEEIERITPVIEWVATNTDAIMSIDTYRPTVAAAPAFGSGPARQQGSGSSARLFPRPRPPPGRKDVSKPRGRHQNP